mmetsp:Transcript_68087/g.157997  ORF Transcript_68087/g.157997 Transcript_68087/m.157997 type:complete len:103 (-) Transcript_68087:14-322(-)
MVRLEKARAQRQPCCTSGARQRREPNPAKASTSSAVLAKGCMGWHLASSPEQANCTSKLSSAAIFKNNGNNWKNIQHRKTKSVLKEGERQLKELERQPCPQP